VDSPERLCLLLRTQVDVVLPTGLAVLNAADPLVAAMAPLCDGEVILFAADPAESLLAAHLGGGGRALSVAAGQVVLLGAGAAQAVADLADLGSAGAGADLDSLLAAVAAAWALGLTAEAIRDGVASFRLTCG
jgi:cyanophycin synthetase